jgi:hypothetical protein
MARCAIATHATFISFWMGVIPAEEASTTAGLYLHTELALQNNIQVGFHEGLGIS